MSAVAQKLSKSLKKPTWFPVFLYDDDDDDDDYDDDNDDDDDYNLFSSSQRTSNRHGTRGRR